MSDDCGCGTNDTAPRPSKGDELAHDDRKNPFANGVDRRRLLQTSGTVGEAPTGAAAGTVRPEGDAVASIQASLASLGITFGEMEASFCMDDHCYCG